ncbi:MAG: glycosyltransferase family 4 protein [Pirellulaceae bacterium]|nr:glycosyltransferase family 4 protein [Pirellulaceae bacterium]
MTYLANQSDTYAYRELPKRSSAAQSSQFSAGEATAPLAPKPLRVVHIGPCFSRGGAENHAIDLARFLDPSRVRIEKCIVTDPNMLDPAVAADMPVPVEPGDELSVRQAAREHDVVMFWGMMLDSWLADCRPPLCVYLAHGDSYWTHDLLVGSRRVVDHVVAVSQGVQRKVCDGFPSSVILNGVDTARLSKTRSRQQVRASLGFQPDDFVLGFVGRLSPEKRADRVIRATAQLPPNFKALVVGWGPLRQELFELANDLIPGRFAFVSADRHLGDYYQSLDTLCLLSEFEGFALVVLEAMMCGRPVIATPVGSVPEAIIDRVNGLVVDGEVESVCQAARRLWEHPDWARGVAAEGRRYAEQHGHAWRMARQYEQLFERLWTEKHGRGADRQAHPAGAEVLAP